LETIYFDTQTEKNTKMENNPEITHSPNSPRKRNKTDHKGDYLLLEKITTGPKNTKRELLEQSQNERNFLGNSGHSIGNSGNFQNGKNEMSDSIIGIKDRHPKISRSTPTIVSENFTEIFSKDKLPKLEKISDKKSLKKEAKKPFDIKPSKSDPYTVSKKNLFGRTRPEIHRIPKRDGSIKGFTRKFGRSRSRSEPGGKITLIISSGDEGTTTRVIQNPYLDGSFDLERDPFVKRKK